MKSNIIILWCAINVALAKHHHHHRRSHYLSHLKQILNPRENFFNMTNGHIQNVLNKMFDLLGLSKVFIDEPKIKLLLKMFYDLNNIAEKNCEIYDVLRNVTAVTADNKAVNKIGLHEIVRDTLTENHSHDEIKDKKSKHITRSSQVTKKPLPGFNDSSEFRDFIKGFLGKIKNLTVDDLFKKKGSSKLYDSSRRNLKVWEPPEKIELDWSINGTDSRRIFRGKKTNIETFPFVASIHILEDFTCAGSIIGRDLVLTAASCVQIHYNNRFFRENPKTTYVRIGSDWTSRRGEIVPVLEIYFYPTYDPKTLKHNMAVLRLERTIRFQERRRTKVRRIQLDRGDGNLPANTRDVVILGWGAKKPNQIVYSFEKLTVAFLDIYHIEACKEIYSKEYITETNFCAGFLSKGGGACNRDVGAPGVVGGVLVGVVSFGAPVCGALDAPTVFTRVGHYRDWLEPIIEDHPPRYGVPKTTKMTSRALVYYFNTMTQRTPPHMYPISPMSFLPTLRAKDEDEESPEEDVLQKILVDLTEQNNSMINEIINQDLTDDFYDIINFTAKEYLNIAQHPLINKTLYLIPSIHFMPNDSTIQSVQPTYELQTTVMDISDTNLRMNATKAIMYESEDYRNYESAPKEQQNKYNDYVDSYESRQEYLDKLQYNKHNNVEDKITQPMDAESTTIADGDYSRDVQFEI